MEAQSHRTHGRDYDDPLHPADDLHGEEGGGETRSTMQKVKEKVDKLKATIKHGHGHGHHGGDEAQAVNDSPAVRSGLAEPTVMGTPVLAEDLYATHSDIVDTPVRSFAQWEDEERHDAPPPLSTAYETHLTEPPPHHTYGGQDVITDQLSEGGTWKLPADLDEDAEGHGSPPPLSTGFESTHLTGLPHVGHHTYDGQEDVNKEQLKGSIGKPTLDVEELERQVAKPPQYTGTYGTDPTDLSQIGHDAAYGDQDVEEQQMGIGKSSGMDEGTRPMTLSPADFQIEGTDTKNTGGEEVGITEVLKSFHKMNVIDEPNTKSLESDQNEPEVYTGSHDQFSPEPVEIPPLDTIAANPSNPSSSYSKRISSATSAVTDKATAVKDSIVSKLSSSGENKSAVSHKPYTMTDFSHKVADTLSGTLGPVYEKVAGAGSSAMSKMQGPGLDDSSRSPATPEGKKGVTVKEYLVDVFKPRDDDKELSEVITHALHRGKGKLQPPLETSTTTCVIRDEGERRLQDSGN